MDRKVGNEPSLALSDSFKEIKRRSTFNNCGDQSGEHSVTMSVGRARSSFLDVSPIFSNRELLSSVAKFIGEKLNAWDGVKTV